jgi:hypothetical protein
LSSSIELEDAMGQNDAKNETSANKSGWIQSFLTKVLSNISVEISHLNIVYRDNDIACTLHIDSLNVFSCSPSWNQAFSV